MDDNNMYSPIQINKTRRLVLTGLLFAIALILSLVEDAIPPVVPIPGVKFGLSNIVVMFILFYMGYKNAFALAILKAIFVFATKGMVAGILSFLGGILSIITMLCILFLFQDRVSYLVISIFGAIFHNIGQFAGITILYSELYLWYYLPVLLLSGLVAGIITSTLLRFILPVLKKMI